MQRRTQICFENLEVCAVILLLAFAGMSIQDPSLARHRSLDLVVHKTQVVEQLVVQP